jgi:hypothetical protein
MVEGFFGALQPFAEHSLGIKASFPVYWDHSDV